MDPYYIVERNGCQSFRIYQKIKALKIFEGFEGKKRLIYCDDYGQVVLKRV